MRACTSVKIYPTDDEIVCYAAETTLPPLSTYANVYEQCPPTRSARPPPAAAASPSYRHQKATSHSHQQQKAAEGAQADKAVLRSEDEAANAFVTNAVSTPCYENAGRQNGRGIRETRQRKAGRRQREAR